MLRGDNLREAFTLTHTHTEGGKRSGKDSENLITFKLFGFQQGRIIGMSLLVGVESQIEPYQGDESKFSHCLKRTNHDHNWDLARSPPDLLLREA